LDKKTIGPEATLVATFSEDELISYLFAEIGLLAFIR
jgi:hypothetical protein